jgi:hypothetical protein
MSPRHHHTALHTVTLSSQLLRPCAPASAGLMCPEHRGLSVLSQSTACLNHSHAPAGPPGTSRINGCWLPCGSRGSCCLLCCRGPAGRGPAVLTSQRQVCPSSGLKQGQHGLLGHSCWAAANVPGNLCQLCQHAAPIQQRPESVTQGTSVANLAWSHFTFCRRCVSSSCCAAAAQVST